VKANTNGIADKNIEPKYVKVGAGKRIVILDEAEFNCLIDAVEAAEARAALHNPHDKEIDWETASKGLIENRIAEVRKAKKFSQKELALRLGVQPSTLSRWERKDANLTLETLRKIAAALGCEVVELIS
jgi:DNA-binding Xre family transcriptional regulator